MLVVLTLIIGVQTAPASIYRPQIPRERTYPGGRYYDGELLEKAKGRRWFIMRTGGAWKE